jgi:hypothetical protein
MHVKNKISNFRGVVSPRGAFFVFAIFSTLCHLEAMGWGRYIDRQTLIILYAYTNVTFVSDFLLRT